MQSHCRHFTTDLSGTIMNSSCHDSLHLHYAARVYLEVALRSNQSCYRGWENYTYVQPHAIRSKTFTHISDLTACGCISKPQNSTAHIWTSIPRALYKHHGRVAFITRSTPVSSHCGRTMEFLLHNTLPVTRQV